MVQLRKTPPRHERTARPKSELELMKQQILHKTDDVDGFVPKQNGTSQESGSRETTPETSPESPERQITSQERKVSNESTESETGSNTSESESKTLNINERLAELKISEPINEKPPPPKPQRSFEDNTPVEKRKENLVQEKKEEIVERKISVEVKEEVKSQKTLSQLESSKKPTVVPVVPKSATNGATDEVDENYNSDLDPDNENQSPVMATLVKKISAMRATGKNGNGYVYVFTDSVPGSEEVRVKVATSRCPMKRVQQAKRFNPDIRLVGTFPVSQTLSALNDIHASLSSQALNGFSDWFTGALDDLLEQVKVGANKYPSKTIHDATTAESES